MKIQTLILWANRTTFTRTAFPLSLGITTMPNILPLPVFLLHQHRADRPHGATIISQNAEKGAVTQTGIIDVLFQVEWRKLLQRPAMANFNGAWKIPTFWKRST